MILRTPTEDENGGTSLRTFSPRLVIPAHAGIQVCFPPQLAWIPAGAILSAAEGRLWRNAAVTYSGCSFFRSSTHKYFQRRLQSARRFWQGALRAPIRS